MPPDYRREDTRELLVRLEERIIAIQKEINSIQGMLNDEYVTKKEFAPVQRSVYAAIGLILAAFIGTLITIAFKGGFGL